MKGENEAKLEKFLHWAAAIGISDSLTSCNSSCLGGSLFVSDFPEAGGRGLAAARDMRKGELILRVPKVALMTSGRLYGDDQNLSAALKNYPLHSSTQILSVALLNEVNKGKSSWWYPYLNQLPQCYDLLASFGQFEIEALQIDDAIWTAEKAVHKAKMEWEEANPLMSKLNLKPQFVSFTAWLWASATISSRTMHVAWDTAGCLCPVGDFFNYASPEEDSFHLENSKAHDRLIDAGYDEALGSYCFYAKRDYRKGDQVLLTYGTYTNMELLEHYGFLLSENPNDKAFISLEPEMYSICSWPKEFLYISHDGKPSFALLSTVRLWATPASKRRSVGHIVHSGHHISIENEVAVMEWIAKKCQVSLSSCLTSIEEDKLILDIIDNIQDYDTESLENVHSLVKSEVYAFLRCHNVMRNNPSTKLHISMKARRSLYRWKLAVEWRYCYKKILTDCIVHCNEILKNHYFMM